MNDILHLMRQSTKSQMYGSALLSAALVGLFTVLKKWLLIEMIPALTAGAWIYLAAGVALLPWAIREGGMNFSKPLITIGWIWRGPSLDQVYIL